jgi:hypothetical protein
MRWWLQEQVRAATDESETFCCCNVRAGLKSWGVRK